MSGAIWFRDVMLFGAFICACLYLGLYLFNPRRERRTLVGSMLLHLGYVQVLVYTGTIIRLHIAPRFNFPMWFEELLPVVLHAAAASLTFWVLVAYLSVQRGAKGLASVTEEEWMAREESVSVDPKEWATRDRE